MANDTYERQYGSRQGKFVNSYLKSNQAKQAKNIVTQNGMVFVGKGLQTGKETWLSVILLFLYLQFGHHIKQVHLDYNITGRKDATHFLLYQSRYHGALFDALPTPHFTKGGSSDVVTMIYTLCRPY